VLSSIVSKAYIFLLIKIFYRVIGMELVTSSHVMDLMFVFGVVGMIAGSVNAIFSHDLRRMVAFSSVAQIGYIYAGLGLGTNIGFVAAIYHMLMPAPRARCSSPPPDWPTHRATASGSPTSGAPAFAILPRAYASAWRP